MKRKSRHVEFMPAALARLLWLAGPAVPQHRHPQPADMPAHATAAAKGEQTLKVGKKDDVEFGVETAVGEMRLKPGRYQIQHRVDGADHFVHFTEVTKDVSAHSKSGGGVARPTRERSSAGWSPWRRRPRRRPPTRRRKARPSA